MPFLDFGIGDEREGCSGEIDGEGLLCVWVEDGKVREGGLDEGDVFFGAEEDFDGLPADEAAGCEGWDAGW